MGARSYVPQLGRFLQPDPIPGGSANAYSYTFGDPVNTTDPTGDYVEGAYLNAFNDNQNKEAVEREEAREAAARAAAERAAHEAAEAAAAAAGPQYAGGEEQWEEWEEDEGEYEYAAYDHSAKPGQEEAHAEGVLDRSLGGEQGAGEGASFLSFTIPLCVAGSEGPCADPTTWTHAVRGRTVRVLCSGAVFFCGATNSGDEKFESYVQHNASQQRLAPPAEQVAPADDEWWWRAASEDGSGDDD